MIWVPAVHSLWPWLMPAWWIWPWSGQVEAKIWFGSEAGHAVHNLWPWLMPAIKLPCCFIAIKAPISRIYLLARTLCGDCVPPQNGLHLLLQQQQPLSSDTWLDSQQAIGGPFYSSHSLRANFTVRSNKYRDDTCTWYGSLVVNMTAGSSNLTF